MKLHWSISVITVIILLVLFQCCNSLPRVYKPGSKIGDDGPLYPITASWFKDRYSLKEWEETLKKFSSIGGDTVVLRAPALIIRSPGDIQKDPDFHWCKTGLSGLEPLDCVTEAQQDLVKVGLKIKAFATYLYEEDYGDKIIHCPQYEKRINSSRIYYRLVFSVDTQSSGSCDLPAGTEVLVVFTSFSGIDPHKLLVQSAKAHKMSVYFGLPAAPKTNMGRLDADMTEAYYSFVKRVLTDHSYRYNYTRSHGDVNRHELHQNVLNQEGVFHMSQNGVLKDNRNVDDVILGYYGRDEVCLAELPDELSHDDYPITALYRNLGSIVHSFTKKLMLSPYIDLNRSQSNVTLSQHVHGFEMLASAGVVDIIAVHEGRGYGKGCYYYEHEINKTIYEVDPGLLKIVQYLDPTVPNNVTYREQFVGSNNELFKMLSDSRDKIQKAGSHFEFWLNVEAFEYLRDDPCLPVDTHGSGMSERIQRTSKSRIDWALSVAGLYPNKVISFAWDPDYTCTSNEYNQSLADDILNDEYRPILMYCGWHSRYNMSIVVIGHGLLSQLTQGYDVDYQIREGTTQHATDMHGYYFESDWGAVNHRIPSLIYTQLFDIMNPYDISLNGTVTVRAGGSNHPCVFTYDFR